jgi:exodeoxyribonuclease VII small subunit
MAKKTPREEVFNFERAMERLEAIVGEIEKGVPLDAMMKLYEEGARLSKECLSHLQATELTLKRLTKEIDGSLSLTEE